MANEGAGSLQQDASPGSSARPEPYPRPSPARYASTPSFESPQRHHRRNPIARRPVKETLNARSEYTLSQDDGTAEHRINQYVIKQEIGRGSFGAVHVAVDQYGNEYAVKEFSKARLRKRAKSQLLRQSRGPKRPADGLNSPFHRQGPGLGDEEMKNALYFIKEEIAIMKKLHHNNLVSLIEVLDDPTQDSLYMVMEMCKKGVVMKVTLEERADPYDDERCRCWFRDLILGIEYLHAQGIVHRDIKPDNCLITNDDVLKVVDFGVSEMFEKNSDMFTAKSAGSPSFLPPELCVVKHGDVSGKAADIWSMGVTLYCLRYGKLPFEEHSIIELYDAIKNRPIVCDGETDEVFKDLMLRILEKDPAKRIQMDELREHPWVTKNGMDPLLPKSENTAEIVDLPTEEEMNSAITKNFGHVLAVMKAAKKFKSLLGPTRASTPIQSILGQEYETHFVEPPTQMDPEESVSLPSPLPYKKTQSLNTYNRRAWERDDVVKGYHPQRREALPCPAPESGESGSAYSSILNRPTRKDSGSIRSVKIRDDPIDDLQSQSSQIPLSRTSSTTTKRSIEGTRGHARDPLEEDCPFLFIGPSTFTGSAPIDINSTDVSPKPLNSNVPMVGAETDPTEPDYPVVSESPGAADFDIYETAYRQEIERIRADTLPGKEGKGSVPMVYLTRRVDGKDELMKLVRETTMSEPALGIGAKVAVPQDSGFRSAVSIIRTQLEQGRHERQQQQSQELGSLNVSETSDVETSASTQEGATASTAATGTESLQSDGQRGRLRSLLTRAKLSRSP
ncbi:protein cmkC [Aspergillus nidulans FGSC A4]|uniref:Calcium/calmodulin-dependent protein kinase CMKC (Eurofung) n=1 Tax=Emericella nidulans (strain FGSC A4 / ATCC 38163 / CBS 112.46 / NRRL 194 / M139) TaxID=227321 RepID=C8V9K6_EMENI|nr:protein cmkC [Aspergillus nidulans FGSC A4]CBF77936.1 TPA: calcium/calmodulin-dependent protein kinase CMKC (Eurofung) [Aspergillus nidulans FGSC A4]